MILNNTDIKTILDSGKKLVCFGAGKALRECCEQWSNLDFVGYIHCVLDNNAKRFEWAGSSLAVHTPDCFLLNEKSLDDVVFLITTWAYPEIFDQLENIPQLRETECYIYPFVQHRPAPYDFPKPPVGAAQKIPKKIHYVWFGGGEIPEKNRKWMESWKKYCPDYEIIRWDESNYDVNKHSYMRDAYKEKKYAFASDYARLDIVHEHGGIYLDCDVEVLKSLDVLLYDEGFYGFTDIGHVSNGLGFGAIKGLDIMREMLVQYDKCSLYNPDGTLDFSVHTSYQMNVFNNHGLRLDNTLQTIAGVRIYPTDVLNPIDYLCNPIACTKNTLTVHHYDISWFDKENATKRSEMLKRSKDFWTKHSCDILRCEDE